MKAKREPPANSKRLSITLTVTFFSTVVLLTIYEALKQMIAPQITIWESHTITIIFGSIVSVLAVYFVYRKQQKLICEITKAKNEAENALKIKDEFLYTISHEFKTPLTVIYAAIQVLELIHKKDISEKASKHIKRIKQNTFRQMRLVNNLLDITKVESGFMNVYFKNINIVEMTRAVTESVAFYANQRGIALNFFSEIPAKVIAVDEEKFERIMLNLLSNAIKYTPKGKAITVKVWEDRGRINILVADEGIGIPQDKLETIFQRFVQVDNTMTRKAEGTGIGLSLVNLLVLAQHWKISVESVEGKGSYFTLHIPILHVLEGMEDRPPRHMDGKLVQQTAVEFSDIY